MAWPSNYPSGTLGFLKDRISDELAREDLTSEIAAAISDAIRTYQKEQFRFCETFTATFYTVIDQQNYNILTDVNFPQLTSINQFFHIAWVTITVPPAVFDLPRIQPEEIFILNQTGTQRGQPYTYAYDNETIFLYPVSTKGDGPVGHATGLTLLAGGSGYANGTYTGIPLTGGTGEGLTGTVVVAGGVVTSVTIVDGGAGYLIGDTVSATSASLGVVPVGSVTGQIATFSMLSGGQGYAGGTFSNVPLTGGSGTGATAIVVVEASETIGGRVVSVAIEAPGQNYVLGDLLSANLAPAPTNEFSGPISALAIVNAGSGTITDGTYSNQALTGGSGSGATAIIVVFGGVVVHIVAQNPGAGYAIGDQIAAPNLPGPVGQIKVLTIIDGGEGYTDNVYTNKALTGGSGTGATADITVVGTRVIACTIRSSGTNYLAGDRLSCATIGPGNEFSVRVDVIGVASFEVIGITLGGVEGQITGMTNLVGASGYVDGTYLNVALTGGSGAEATANIVVAGGAVTSIAIVNPGIGYVETDILSSVASGAFHTGRALSNFLWTGGVSGYTPGTYTGVALFQVYPFFGHTGTGAVGTIVVSGAGVVTSVTFTSSGSGYQIGDTLSAILPGTPIGEITVLGTVTAGSGYTNGAYFINLTGGSGAGASAKIDVISGSVFSVKLNLRGNNYQVGDVLSAALPGGGAGFTVTVLNVGFTLNVSALVADWSAVVSAVSIGSVTQGNAFGFQLQVNTTSDGAVLTTLVSAGFSAQVNAIITQQTGYLITLGGHVAYPEPQTDSEVGNRWMETAERLIRAQAKYNIAVNVTNNQLLAQAMSPETGAVATALRELRVEANRMMRRGVLKAMPF